ncbi:guanine nucleotide exchange factor for Rab-3A isoform X3 [Echinops telfairi]|uniref:Guanine nucleotide exchange factor for Rab-3A isoform X3 n=1 Tax=Echinops telfairi TaxID=9371 RepID=A0AC55DMQ9_ECHTE|nr:guanine nucleotide exchange factor for Rab-3A isoform X3 [Echinops telfairi]
MGSPQEPARCPARGACPVFLAMSSGTVRYAPSGLSPDLEGSLGEEAWDTDSQPSPDEGRPPPLGAVPGAWKSLKGRRESPGTPAETSAGEEGPAAAQLDVARLRSSSVEIREKGSEFLKEELRRAQKELKLKDEECERLSKVREQLEQELEELTASLFEEAHKMVREANMQQAASEKQLKEARGKMDMLQAEVTALKTLVITSTPASPNRELHPQLLSPTKGSPRKGHARHKSTSSTLCPAVCPAAGHTLTPDREGKEVDTILFAEFQAWRESPSLDRTSPFMDRVYREDVGPCLDFTTQELSALVRAAVEDNTLTIEPVASQTLPMVKLAEAQSGSTNTCALSGLARACRHRIRLGDSKSHYYISPSSRARITAVCNFFTYIRYIQQGLVRQDGGLRQGPACRGCRAGADTSLGTDGQKGGQGHGASLEPEATHLPQDRQTAGLGRLLSSPWTPPLTRDFERNQR